MQFARQFLSLALNIGLGVKRQCFKQLGPVIQLSLIVLELYIQLLTQSVTRCHFTQELPYHQDHQQHEHQCITVDGPSCPCQRGFALSLYCIFPFVLCSHHLFYHLGYFLRIHHAFIGG